MTMLLLITKILKEKELVGFIVTNSTNIFYLTGFKGVLPAERESILVFNPTPTLITARIYQNEARRIQSKDLKAKIVNERNQILESVQKLLTKCKRVGFEENDLKYGEYQEFKKWLKPIVTDYSSSERSESRSYPKNYNSINGKFSTSSNNNKLQLIPTKNLIEDLRVIKTEDEVKRIEKAQIISQNAFDILVKTIKIDQTEAEIAEKLAQIIKSLGANGLAFESIVASGENSGLPHYVTDKKKVKHGEVLLFDFGAKYKDYCADLSRTIFIGKTSDRQRNIYHHVLTAQKRAIEIITSGIKASDVYNTANDYFKKHKLDKYFLHGLGHGIGLDVHETPHLRSGLPTINDQLLTNGMVFSVEPGLYFPWGGIRIEDLIVIKNGRAKVLGKLIDEIIEV